MKREATGQKILDKALELFSTQGYDAVSVEKIAKAVGIKAPSLYNHFPSKQAIFDAIVESTVKLCETDTAKVNVHVQNAQQDVPVFSAIDEDALCEKVRQLFIYSIRNETVSRFRRMMTIEQFRAPTFAAMYESCFVQPMIEYHADIFRALIADGTIRAEDPEALALMYIAPVLTLVGVCDRQPEREDECLAKLEKHVRLFFRVVRRDAAQADKTKNEIRKIES